jgi:hypothetical protein
MSEKTYTDIIHNANNASNDDADWIADLENGTQLHISFSVERNTASYLSDFSTRKRQRFVGGLLLIICSFLLFHVGQYIDKFERGETGETGETPSAVTLPYYFRFGVWINILIGFVFNEAIQLLFI